MENIDKQGSLSLPALISLPVLRPDCCDQKTTDVVLAHLWEKEAEVVAELAAEERYPFPECRNDMYRKACYGVEEVLREEKIEGFEHGKNDIVIMHVLCEISRRLRVAQDLKEMPVLGKALGPSPEGPFPPLVEIEIDHGDDWRSEKPMTQEMADRVCGRAYEKDQRLMYRAGEERRHFMRTYKSSDDMEVLIKEVKKEEMVEKIYGFRRELEHRLDVMCQMPPYEEIVRMVN